MTPYPKGGDNVGKNDKKTDKTARIAEEYERIAALYADLPQDKQSLYDGLMRRGAYIRVTLEDMEADIDKDGYVESFTQSEKTEPYERQRPVASLYNSMVKNYQTIMKQLADALPAPLPEDAATELKKFNAGR